MEVKIGELTYGKFFNFSENKEFFKLAINDRKTIVGIYPQDKTFILERITSIPRSKKIWWCKREVNSNIMDSEELYNKVLQILEDGIPTINGKELFDPRSNKNGFINNVFLPFFLISRIDNEKFVVCDNKFQSYPTVLLDNMIITSKELEQVKNMAIENSLKVKETEQPQP